MSDIAAAYAAAMERNIPSNTMTLRKATVLSASPFIISMNGTQITGVSYSPMYWPVVGDVVLVLMDDASPFVLCRATNRAPYSYTPVVSYSGGGGSLGSTGTSNGEWLYDGARIVGNFIITWGGAGVAGGTNDLRITLPVSARSDIGVAVTQQPMVGFGWYFDSSSLTLLPIQARAIGTNGTFTVNIYHAIDTTSYTWGGATPFAPQTGDALMINFAYFPDR